MKKLELFYPVDNHRVNQEWGVKNTEKYKKLGLTFAKHNGIDIGLVINQPIFSPIDGVVINTRPNDNPGGISLSIISKEPYIFANNIVCYVLLDFLHCQKVVTQTESFVSSGEIIALGGNTGTASTGPHLHLQLRRVVKIKTLDPKATNTYRIDDENYVFSDVDRNDANNSINPGDFFNGVYASDYNPEKIKTLMEKVESLRLELEKLKKISAVK